MKYLYVIFVIKIINNRFTNLEKSWKFLKPVKLYYKNVSLKIL